MNFIIWSGSREFVFLLYRPLASHHGLDLPLWNTTIGRLALLFNRPNRSAIVYAFFRWCVCLLPVAFRQEPNCLLINGNSGTVSRLPISAVAIRAPGARHRFH